MRPLIPLVACLAVAGCGASTAHDASVSTTAALATWKPYTHAKRVLDLAGPRSDGSLVVAAHGRLLLLTRSGRLRQYATGYTTSARLEPYITLARGCFGARTVYAIHFRRPRGVVAVSPGGVVRTLARLSAPGLINGITYDSVGRFGHRLLVTVNNHGRTTVSAIGCRGAVRTITSSAPRVEGGIAVAPEGFGRLAGDLIAPDEIGGGIWAITPSGASRLVAASGLPHGQDIGVESEGFVPAGRHHVALVADRVSRGNRHPGVDEVLALRASAWRPGDLLVVSEGGALTDLVRCGPTSCRAREVAVGPRRAHVEGHVAFR